MRATLLIVAGVLAASAAGAEEADKETAEMIMAKLAEMGCQMAPEDIEVEGDGYDLDDVICVGGQQFDIKLDKDFNEVGRRAE